MPSHGNLNMDKIEDLVANLVDTAYKFHEIYCGTHMVGYSKKSEEAGKKLRAGDLVNDVHAAMEVAIDSGDFSVAKELAKNPAIPETQQTTLRSAIKTAETARTNKIKEGQQELINKTTSDTIREYFGEVLTVATLNDRHEKGLIRDSEFKCMMKVDRRDGFGYPRTVSDMENLIGQFITFSYEDLSDKGVPCKPVGEEVRKCDQYGNPQE